MRKANGKGRIWVDYGALNTRTAIDRCPSPSIQLILSTLGGSMVFSKIHLVSGFQQIRIHDEDIEENSFSTRRLGPSNELSSSSASAMHYRRFSVSAMTFLETT